MANQPNSAASAVRRQLSRDHIGWLLLGVFIGLLIGWIAWPVGWAETGMDDLPPDVRAQFVSATADAYVASGGQDPATALTRMQAFADPQAAVYEAIAFYQNGNDSTRSIREVNLRSLASALGATSPTAGDSADSPEIGLVDWILGIITALLLLGGGIWIGLRLLLQWRAAQNEEEPDTFYPPSEMPYQMPTPPTQPAQPVSSWQPAAPADATSAAPGGQRTGRTRVVVETWDGDEPTPTPASPLPRKNEDDRIQRIIPPAPSASFAPDEDEFDDAGEGDEDTPVAQTGDEKESEWSSWRFGDSFVAARPAPQPDEEDSGWVNDLAEPVDPDAVVLDDAFDDEDYDEFEDEPEDEFQDDADSAEDEGFRPISAPIAAPAALPTKWGPGAASKPIPDKGKEDEDEGKFLPTVQGVLSSFLRGDKENSPSRSSGKEIATFMAEFHVGILAYEQSFTITSTGDENGAPLGACGAGISERLDKEAAHSEKVRVLDIWLYDGTEVRSYNQYLTAPGMDREALAGQAPSSGTITGEPLEIVAGLSFRIASKNLLLDCRVLNAEFLSSDTPPNPLRTVRIEMTARSLAGD